jgi:hypothetical protein
VCSNSHAARRWHLAYTLLMNPDLLPKRKLAMLLTRGLETSDDDNNCRPAKDGKGPPSVPLRQVSEDGCDDHSNRPASRRQLSSTSSSRSENTSHFNAEDPSNRSGSRRQLSSTSSSGTRSDTTSHFITACEDVVVDNVRLADRRLMKRDHSWPPNNESEFYSRKV